MQELLPVRGNLFEMATAVAETEKYQDLTWDLQDQGYSRKMLDGIEAVRQSVYLIMNTPKYQHIIYSFAYGNDLQKLLGKENKLIEAEIKGMVADALSSDERVLEVKDFQLEFANDQINVSFVVLSIYGEFKSEAVIRN